MMENKSHIKPLQRKNQYRNRLIPNYLKTQPCHTFQLEHLHFYPLYSQALGQFLRMESVALYQGNGPSGYHIGHPCSCTQHKHQIMVNIIPRQLRRKQQRKQVSHKIPSKRTSYTGQPYFILYRPSQQPNSNSWTRDRVICSFLHTTSRKTQKTKQSFIKRLERQQLSKIKTNSSRSRQLKSMERNGIEETNSKEK